MRSKNIQQWISIAIGCESLLRQAPEYVNLLVINGFRLSIASFSFVFLSISYNQLQIASKYGYFTVLSNLIISNFTSDFFISELISPVLYKISFGHNFKPQLSTGKSHANCNKIYALLINCISVFSKIGNFPMSFIHLGR